LYQNLDFADFVGPGGVDWIISHTINQSNFTVNLKTATTSGGLQRRTKINPNKNRYVGISMSPSDKAGEDKQSRAGAPEFPILD
jgi:hypothetical protein